MPRLPLTLLGLSLLGAVAASQDTQQLFLDNCASCHGETGQGDGWAELDRPARSFADGGFSYGNTPEALFRTISIGIPGTPMPGFDSSLTEEQRRALAQHVLALGPAVRAVSTEETILVVRDRPLIVRGMLPPITDGATTHARGILIGTTDGLTFEYRADDVRLLGVRQGDFVERTDWTGRGGTALKPLGQVVHVVAGGSPRALFRWGSGLTAELRGSWVRGSRAGLTYDLGARGGAAMAHVREEVHGLTTSIASGFVRHFEVTPGPLGLNVTPSQEAWRTGEELDAFWTRPIGSEEAPIRWTVQGTPEGPQCIGIRFGIWVAPAGTARVVPVPLGGHLELFEGWSHKLWHTFELIVLLPADWKTEYRERLLEVFDR